jgi:hypothetical protein
MKLLNGFPIFLLLIGQAVGGNFSDSDTEVDHVNVWFTKSVGYQPRHIHIAYGSKLLLHVVCLFEIFGKILQLFK